MSLKGITPSRVKLRPRRRLNVWCAVDCAGGELGAMPTPFSISAFPIRGYSIAEDVVCVNALVQSPLVVEGMPSSAWEDYNYKPSVQVTGCNLHRSRERVVQGHA